MKLSTYISTLVAIVAITIPIFLAPQSSALAVDGECTTVETIFARGSGIELNKEDARKFFDSIEGRLAGATNVSRSTYELGTETYAGHKYPAIQADQAPYGNALGAKVSGGYANDYGKSVDAGVGELYNYLTQRHEKCKASGTKYILGGYSQGAQVVGQTLPKLSDELRGNIFYVALFGDPKLHLPEGEGINPPACQGKDLSAYRRVIANCKVDNGSLGARKPYLPSKLDTKTGLWCYEHDYVCGVTHNVLDNDGHGKYKDDNMAIDQAALEIASRLKQTLPADQQDTIDTKPHGNASGQPDVVYIIDTTGSMGSRIEQAKNYVRNSSARIQALNGRTALVAYRDAGDAYTARVISPLSGDLTGFRTGLDSLSVGGGGDLPEAGLHALMTSFDQLEWRNGATKAAVLITDAPYHDPDRVDGSTLEAVAKRSLEIDPVNVYPVVPSYAAADYRQLADRTSGQVIVDNGNTEEALSHVLEKITQRPVALLKNTHYQGDPGQEFTFDASDSFIVDSTITQYEWDFEGDGVFDTSTTEPVANHTYSHTFDGNMQVRLHGANGTIANASAVVQVGTYAIPTLPATPDTVTVQPTSTVGSTSAVRLSWASATPSAKWAISLNDTVLGTVEGSQLTLEISDVDRLQDATFAVAGLADDGTIGTPAITTLAKQTAPPQPPAPAPKTCILQRIATLLNHFLSPYLTIRITC